MPTCLHARQRRLCQCSALPAYLPACLPIALPLSAAGDLLAGVDMAPLHRCVHIHACLGRLHQFSEYYAQNRRQQVRRGWAGLGWAGPSTGCCCCYMAGAGADSADWQDGQLLGMLNPLCWCLPFFLRCAARG